MSDTAISTSELSHRRDGRNNFIRNVRILWNRNASNNIPKLFFLSSHHAFCALFNYTHKHTHTHTYIIISLGAVSQRGPWPLHSWGFVITHNNAPHSVGLLWTSDQLVTENSTWQETTLTSDRHPCHPVGFEPMFSAGERPRTYALDRTATGTGPIHTHTHTHTHIYIYIYIYTGSAKKNVNTF